MDTNIVQLEGNVSRDVELMAGGKYCFVNIAVNRAHSGGSDFISVKAFKDLAKTCAESLKKGDRVSVTGYLSSGSFIPKDGTEKVYRTDVVIDKIRKLPKGDNSGAGAFIDGTAGGAAAAIGMTA
jgi:single-stranded DNA-binding protein